MKQGNQNKSVMVEDKPNLTKLKTIKGFQLPSEHRQSKPIVSLNIRYSTSKVLPKRRPSLVSLPAMSLATIGKPFCCSHGGLFQKGKMVL